MRRTRKINWHRKPKCLLEPAVAAEVAAPYGIRTGDPVAPGEKYISLDRVIRRARKTNLRRKMRRHVVLGFVAEVAAQYGIRPPDLPAAPAEKLISPNQAARIVNVSGPAVKEWIRRRHLPAIKLGNGYWKIKVGDLEDFIKARRNLGQKKIMLIDAPGPESRALANAIEQSGQTAVLVYQRIDALRKAEDLHPSLFIANVSVKAFDIWNLLKRIRKSDNIRNAPLLLIADRELQDAENERALELDAQAFLSRPFTPQTLLAEMEKIRIRSL